MRILLEDNDVLMTFDGDLILDHNTGDLRSENITPDELVTQKIMLVLQTSSGDWNISGFGRIGGTFGMGGVGADLNDFAGLPNKRAVGEALKERIYFALTTEGMLSPSALSVEVYPASQNALGVIVSYPSFFRFARQDEDASPLILLNLEYDLRDNKLVPRKI